MTKEEERNYLKPFRCVGGFIFFITIISIIMSFVGYPVILWLFSILGFENEIMTYNIIEIENILMKGYAYYVGYRIFLKKYDIKLSDSNKKNNKSAIKYIFTILTGLILCFFAWFIWDMFLNRIGYIPKNEEMHFFGIIYAIILAPIFEELIFRGYIIGILKKYGNVVAIFISAILFGLFHATATQSISAIFVGIVFGIIAIKYNSIIPTIIMHILNNTCSVLGQFESFALLLNNIKSVIIILSIIIIICYVILNLKNIKKIFEGLKITIRLQFKSISYIIAIISFLYFIIIDFITNMNLMIS